MNSRIKSSTLYVGNLPLDATRVEVEQIFGDAGPVKKCFIIKSKDESTSYAYVTYALPEDTDTAAEELKDATLRGQKLKVSVSSRKHKSKDTTDKGNLNEPKKLEHKGKKPARKLHTTSGEAPDARGQKAVPSKKGRLIVRNLSFKVTEEAFRKHFTAVGSVTEVKLLRKPNGLLVGCGFVQYKHEKHAQQAIQKYNTKPFLGRPIVIDWAVNKLRYDAAQSRPDQTQGRKRSLEDDDHSPDSTQEKQSRPRIETSDSEQGDNGGAEAEEEEANSEEEDDEQESEVFEDEIDDESEDDGKDDSDEHAETSDDGSDHDEAGTGAKSKRRVEQGKNDVSDGTTLFIKNMSFDTDEGALRQLLSQYGGLRYAVVCVDPLTEHSRGTAFVRFKSREAAEEALAAAADPDNAAQFTLDGRRIEVLPAIDRDELQQRIHLDRNKSTQGKDKRNLYLAREGLVREGSKAAEGVSRDDLNKRVGLEKWKTKMLKNLNMFVSQTRLCVHNLPVHVDDARLRDIFQTHVPTGVITEARVMRDRKDVSTHPRGLSKEYGFVTFTQHEHALTALRNINNNPEVFKPSRRPVVEFAVENRTALDARRKREEKSRQMNVREPPAAAAAGGAGGGRRRRQELAAGSRRGRAATTAAPVPAPAPTLAPARPAHAGMAADPTNKALPRLKVRAGQQENAKVITRKMLKAGKKGSRRERAGHKKDVVQDWMEPAERKKNSRREKKKDLKVREKGRQDDAKFTSLVDKYRQKLAVAPAAGARWFQ